MENQEIKWQLEDECTGGGMRVLYMRNFEFFYCPVKSVKDAIHVINSQSADDLKTNLVSDNSFDLEIMEKIDGVKDWHTYYDNNGQDIAEILEASTPPS